MGDALGVGPDLVLTLVEQSKQIIEQQRIIIERLGQPEPAYFNIANAAKYLGLSGPFIRRAVTSGMLSVSNVGTPDKPAYRISRKDLHEYMEKRKAGAIARPTKRKKGEQAVRTLPPSRHYPTAAHLPSTAA